MLERLRSLFGTAAESLSLDGEYDPVYGLSKRAIEEWLARNPGLRAEYEVKKWLAVNPPLREEYDAELRELCIESRGPVNEDALLGEVKPPPPPWQGVGRSQ